MDNTKETVAAFIFKGRHGGVARMTEDLVYVEHDDAGEALPGLIASVAVTEDRDEGARMSSLSGDLEARAGRLRVLAAAFVALADALESEDKGSREVFAYRQPIGRRVMDDARAFLDKQELTPEKRAALIDDIDRANAVLWCKCETPRACADDREVWLADGSILVRR